MVSSKMYDQVISKADKTKIYQSKHLVTWCLLGQGHEESIVKKKKKKKKKKASLHSTELVYINFTGPRIELMTTK